MKLRVGVIETPARFVFGRASEAFAEMTPQLDPAIRAAYAARPVYPLIISRGDALPVVNSTQGGRDPGY